MRSYVFCLVRALLLGCLFVLAGSGAIEAGVVKVGVYDNKPLVFVDGDGNAKGIFIDLLEHVAAKEQWELRYIPGTWTECLDRLNAGEIDLMTAIAFSEERSQRYDFTYESVITNWAQIFVPKNSKITSVLDLDLKKIAVKMQDIHYYGLRDLAAKFKISCRFIEADAYDVVFELIEAERVQAGLVNRLFGIQNKAGFPVRETSIMFNPIEVRYAAPKTLESNLVDLLDVHLRRMQIEKDPFFTQTLKTWLAVPTEWMLPQTVKYVLFGSGFFLLLFIAMNVTLRMKVKKRTEELSSANKQLRKEVLTRKKAESYLRRYERIVAVSADHMALVDRAYRYRALNDAALKAIGKPRAQIVGKKIWRVVGSRGSEAIHQKRMDRAFSGQIVRYRSWMEFPTLGRRYMDIVFTPYRQKDKQVAGCVANFRDITERHELELKLENAQKMEFMGTIAGGVAHDLNNILSGILSYPDLLLMQLPKESKLIKPIETIKKSGEKAAVIVQDLLTLARRGVANKEPLNLNDIISTFLNSPECKKIISFHPSVRIKTALSDGIHNILGSTVHLSKTVMNLVSNAAEAMPDGGEITIETHHRHLDAAAFGDPKITEGAYISLEVADNGVGISQQDIDKIFEPFYTKKVMGRSGTGLGLAVVWGTVMDHHGHIRVESDGSSGTRFMLLFPVIDEAFAMSIDRSDRSLAWGDGESILIVDDIEEQRIIASDILNALGYGVETAASGEEAVAKIEKKQFDLVILDMLMPPGMDGLKTYEEILKLHPGQKAIIASGYAETGRVKKALNLGVGQFIKKAYTIEDVSVAVEKELHASS